MNIRIGRVTIPVTPMNFLNTGLGIVMLYGLWTKNFICLAALVTLLFVANIINTNSAKNMSRHLMFMTQQVERLNLLVYGQSKILSKAHGEDFIREVLGAIDRETLERDMAEGRKAEEKLRQDQEEKAS